MKWKIVTGTACSFRHTSLSSGVNTEAFFVCHRIDHLIVLTESCGCRSGRWAWLLSSWAHFSNIETIFRAPRKINGWSLGLYFTSLMRLPWCELELMVVLPMRMFAEAPQLLNYSYFHSAIAKPSNREPVS